MTMRSLLALSLLSFASINLMAQQTQPSSEVALVYTYVHTNAPPGGCGCFSMNGGTGSYAYHYGPQFALVVEVGAVHASKIDGSGLDLTLTSYLGGPRFYYRRPHARFVSLRPGVAGRGARNRRTDSSKRWRRLFSDSLWLNFRWRR